MLYANEMPNYLALIETERQMRVIIMDRNEEQELLIGAFTMTDFGESFKPNSL